MNKHEPVYLITDGCMWEANKRNGTSHAHAIEVVDIETGAVRYITSGSTIIFVEGEISDLRTQEAYNKTTGQKVPTNRQTNVNKSKRRERARPPEKSDHE